MVTTRAVDERRLLGVVERALRDALSGTLEAGDEFPEEVLVAVRERLRSYLEHGPAPALVGAVAAAGILGVQPPHLARLKAQGRMPGGIPVEGTRDVYVRAEVETLARTLRREREARVRRRAEKEATA